VSRKSVELRKKKRNTKSKKTTVCKLLDFLFSGCMFLLGELVGL
jgi:hypothetical protein